ncbi:MAG: FtsW/RodA/SpoVE family cell cycle protein [Chitinophagaceae bacterium]
MYAYSVAGLIFFHIAINISMTIGLAPVIGITLPLLSYGGSSLLTFTVLDLYFGTIRCRQANGVEVIRPYFSLYSYLYNVAEVLLFCRISILSISQADFKHC